MERKTFGRVHIYVREGYNRAMKLADNGNHKEAIEVLVPIVINNPAVPVLFEKLREYEMAYAKKATPTSFCPIKQKLNISSNNFSINFYQSRKSYGTLRKAISSICK